MPLQEVTIKAALRAAQPNTAKKLFDGNGLYLLIKPPRSPAWRLKYRIAKREKLLSLGTYPLTSLKKARDERDDALRLLRDGKDPSAERKSAKATGADTFKTVAEEWLGLQRKTLADETVSIMSGRLNSTLYPAFGSHPIGSIKAADLLAVLRRIELRGRHETAHRVRALFGRIARFGIATGKCERDISQDLRGALAPVQTQHFPSITDPKRIGELLRAIENYDGQQATAFALRLAPYVFVRPGELRGAQWREFTLEGREPIWRIPAERMKAGREHLVPLARPVVTILHELHKLTGDGPLLFPSLVAPTRPISDGTLNAALRRIGFAQGEMSAHGFRTLASTRLNELNFKPDIIELQLAHAEQNATRDAYNRAARLAERRKMMQKWAAYLDGLRQTTS